MDNRVGNVRLMQKINRLKILNFVRENKTALRPEIAEKTGLSLSSVTNIVTYLMSKDIIVSDGSVAEGKVGRRADLLRFKSDSYNLICVLIEKHDFTVTYTDLSGNILGKSVKEIKDGDQDAILKSVVNEVKNIISRFGDETLLAVCMSISALVLKNDIYSANLNWHFTLPREKLKKRLGVPVFIENASDIRAVWQFKGQKHETGNVLLADFEGGIGAVHFTDGERNRNTIGEIGHTTVKKDGDVCVCGNRGCLEAMCSVAKIEASCGKFGFNTFDEIIAAYYSGDKRVIPSLDACGEYLGIGLANLVNLFNPGKIVINGGEYMKCGYILDKAISCMLRRANRLLTAQLEIEKVSISRFDMIRGMSLFLCDEIFSLDFEDEFIEL